MTPPRLICVGLAAIERIVRVNAMPSRGSKGRARGYSERIGGIAAEAAMAARCLGAEVGLSSPVGDDAAGREIILLLTSSGVDVAGVSVVPRARSVSEVVLVDANDQRAGARYEEDALQRAAPLPDLRMLEGARAVLADLSWKQGALHVLTAAGQRGIPAIAVAGADEEDGRVLVVRHGVIEQAIVPELAPSDVTGAFAGAYALAIAEGRPAIAAARFAGVAAELARVAIEDGRGFPSREAVDALVTSR